MSIFPSRKPLVFCQPAVSFTSFHFMQVHFVLLDHFTVVTAVKKLQQGQKKDEHEYNFFFLRIILGNDFLYEELNC